MQHVSGRYLSVRAALWARLDSRPLCSFTYKMSEYLKHTERTGSSDNAEHACEATVKRLHESIWLGLRPYLCGLVSNIYLYLYLYISICLTVRGCRACVGGASAGPGSGAAPCRSPAGCSTPRPAGPGMHTDTEAKQNDQTGVQYHGTQIRSGRRLVRQGQLALTHAKTQRGATQDDQTRM